MGCQFNYQFNPVIPVSTHIYHKYHSKQAEIYNSQQAGSLSVCDINGPSSLFHPPNECEYVHCCCLADVPSANDNTFRPPATHQIVIRLVDKH